MASTRPSLPRLLIVLILALVAAYQVARSAMVTAFVARQPELAARAWPGHPRVLLAGAMGEIGRSAAAGQAASTATVAQAMAAARRGPLLTDPFLIQGAAALSKGDAAAAEALFREARRRDPRSAAARYFLAQQYLMSGRPLEGLAEAAVLTRLVSGGASALIPGLVQYAHEPGAVPKLRQMFAANPGLGDGVMAELARDASNASLLMELAGDEVGTDKAAIPDWQARLVASLIERGDYAEARALWLRMSGLRVGTDGLFNPQFARLAAPAPFNWTLASGKFGVAEPLPSGKLQLIYYGRDNAEFATQLLMLAPGPYELTMQVRREGAGDGPSHLGWTLTCQPGKRRLLDLPLAKADAAGALAGRFTVPADCPAQWLVLGAVAPEFARSEQVTISNLKLTRGGR